MRSYYSYRDAVLDDSPTAYWRMNETAGALSDSSGNGLNTAAPAGSPTYQQTGPLTGDSSNFGIRFPTSAESFTRTDNNLIDISTGDYTIEAWIKSVATATGTWVRKSSGAAAGFVLDINRNGAGTAGFRIFNTAGSSTDLGSSATNVNDGNWHHIVARLTRGASSDTLALFVDGQASGTKAVANTAGQDLSNATDFTFNATSGSFQIVSLSEMAVYQKALSADRIFFHYQAGLRQIWEADAINKYYKFEVYNGSAYLGLLDDVVTEPAISQDINTGAAQLTIDIDASPETIEDDLDPLLDEAGNILQDETGATLYPERNYPPFGEVAIGIKIQLENTIKVYEYSDNNINGKLIFNGWITVYEPDYENNKISVTILSKGADLTEYLIGGTQTVDQSQTVDTASLQTTPILKDYQYIIQSFTVGASGANLSKIEFELNAVSAGDVGQIMDLSLHTTLGDAQAGTNAVATATQALFSTSKTTHAFTFASTVTVTPNTQYFIRLRPDILTVVYKIYANNADAYSGGGGYYFDGAADPINGAFAILTGDWWFKTYYTDNGVTATYTSQDPTNIFKDVIDKYVAQGGQANYSGSTNDTGLSVSYVFKMATALEAVKKCLDLAPYDWYWYVDPGSLIAYFKQTLTTPTHLFIKGNHITSLKLKVTSDNIVNKIYFSGGNTGGGSNLLTSAANSSSDSDRQRLEKMSDNRVTLSATASRLMTNELNRHALKSYQATCTILDSKYDTSTIDLGETAGLEGFGLPIDGIVLQIVRIVRYPNRVELVLGTIPPRLTAQQSQALYDISNLQTVDNPSTSS